MIDIQILYEIIKLGENDDLDLSDYSSMIKDFKKYDFINIIGPDECKYIAKELSINDLFFLIRAIIICERENEWTGGSVASSIWLFRELQNLDYSKSIELANWILPRTNNYYVPFGFNNHNARNYDEYIEINKRRSEQFSRSEQFKLQQEVTARNEREKRFLQRKISNDARKSNYRKDLIDNLNKIPILDQIKILSVDDKYSISFYPTSIVTKSSSEIIKKLDSETVLKLLLKLKGRQKGPWAKFKRNLIEIHFNRKDLPWNRKPWNKF